MTTKFRLSVALAVIIGLLTASVSVSAFHAGEDEYHPIDRESFEDVWERTDRPVAETIEPRSWVWGPGGYTDVLTEPYEEADGGEREVQYFDKSRMEMPNTEGGDSESPWFITQGLLAYELMSGNLQLGDEEHVRYQPSQRSAAGDPEDTTAPTYEAMGDLMDRPARESGEVIIEYANRNGFVVEDSGRFAGYGVTDLSGDDTYGDIDGIDHNIADVFWDFMTSEGIVYEDGDYVNDQPLFLNAFYAVGYPLTDAFWADVLVDGQMQHVLIQAFERRVLTYAPANPEGWEVESGNIGQHYYDWRYNEIGDPIVDVSLSLEQDHDANIVSTEHEFTATLTETDGGAPVDFVADDVAITITRGTDSVIPSDLTIDDITDGVASMTYTGPGSPATDEIDVNVDYHGTAIAGEPTLTKTWQTLAEYHDCDAVVEDGESIQVAVTAASENDVICVTAGDYDENVEILVDGLTLLAVDGADVTTISSDVAGVGVVGTPGVVGINADNVVIDGFTIDNEDAANGRAVRVHASVDGVTIQNNVMQNSLRGVQGDWARAAEGQGGDNITIDNNIFNTDLGVAGTEEMDGLSITGNTFNTTVEGIGLGDGLLNWTIESNHFAGDEDHVHDWRSTPSTSDLQDIIDNNTFENAVEIVNGNAIRDE